MANQTTQEEQKGFSFKVEKNLIGHEGITVYLNGNRYYHIPSSDLYKKAIMERENL